MQTNLCDLSQAVLLQEKHNYKKNYVLNTFIIIIKQESLKINNFNGKLKNLEKDK